MLKPLLPLAALLSTSAVAASPDPAELRKTDQALVNFGTRHSASDTTSPTRGIGAARRYVASRFEDFSKACGGCLKVETVGRSFTGPRAPNGVRIEDVLAIQTGSGDPNQVVIVQGHVDSRRSDVMDATGDSPGANDDASGTSLVVEAARLLSKEKFTGTIVYAALSGEEQGLWGGTLLAETAKARGWKVQAVLNNDIVGNTHGIGGEHIDDVIRVFSEGIEISADAAGNKLMRSIGGEDDSPSRSLAKTVRATAAADPSIGLKVFAVRRADRFGRGGDHTAFLEAGILPAVRFTEPTENYDRQHQDIRTENGRRYGDVIEFVDFPYLAKVTALNMSVIRRLASAPATPEHVGIDGAVSDDTNVTWTPVAGASGYRILWRRADEQYWTDHKDVGADLASIKLPHVNIDDHFFAVSALSAKGAESVPMFGSMPVRPTPGHAR